jgi:sigma-B regulation protein RsbU (phosphoserine phosphatase)
VSLGPKQSEEPYSGSDLRLLQSVVTQTALALENAQLTAVIAAEAGQRERLRRELEIAREVQERLFPQSLPAVPGLDCYGTCRPAQGVGGDYYDFLSLAGGKLGLAVGDVSGKGIAAALLMASLQASLRSHAGRGSLDLAALMSEIHTLVYEASSSNRYATLFYAEYEPGTRGLSYVNAGHNFPVLLRAQGDGVTVVRLETGGTVVGLLKNPSYQQATVTLEPGDVLVAYTDGVSEAMNASEEEWGEESLIAAAKSCAGRTAEEIAHYILGAADRFVAGASQFDDMTLVVLKVLNPC